MAEKFYWLKLQRDFFKRHDIRIVESMPNGKDYVLFYLKLLCESIDHEGRLRFSETLPYNEEMLSTITDTNIDIVRSAVKIFIQLGLMNLMEDGTFYLSEVQKMIGSESLWAEKKRQYRERTLLGHQEDNVLALSDKSKSQSKSKNKSNNISSSAAPSEEYMLEASDPEPSEQEPIVIDFLLNDKSSYGVTQKQIDEWIELFPAIDVIQQLRNIKAWCIAHPENRKTRRGALKFIFGWLTREQNSARPIRPPQPKSGRTPVSNEVFENTKGGEEVW